MAWFQNVTVALKFLPLLFVAEAGWFFAPFAVAAAAALELHHGHRRPRKNTTRSPKRCARRA